MLFKKLKLSFILLFGLGLMGLHAQASLNAAGGMVTGSVGSASYSVGQILYTTMTVSGGSVATGVQQPYEITVLTGIEEAKRINLTLSVYPNPTTDLLTLNIEDFDISNLLFQLFDINGKLLQKENIRSTQTQIVMSNLHPANYLLRISQGNSEIKTFIVVKH